MLTVTSSMFAADSRERRIWAAALLVLASLCACSGPSIRGARITRARFEPEGHLLGEYTPRACTDSRGQPTELTLLVRLVQEADGQPLLAVRRPGYDTMVIRNSFRERGALVFQAAVEAHDGPILLDFRLPEQSGAPGRLTFSRRFEEKRTEGESFRARLAAPSLVCGLDGRAASRSHPSSWAGATL
jgi:hypothetical protein